MLAHVTLVFDAVSGFRSMLWANNERKTASRVVCPVIRKPYGKASALMQLLNVTSLAAFVFMFFPVLGAQDTETWSMTIRATKSPPLTPWITMPSRPGYAAKPGRMRRCWIRTSLVRMLMPAPARVIPGEGAVWPATVTNA